MNEGQHDPPSRDADRSRDELLAALAHELRTPLAPIRSGLQLLRYAPASPEAADRIHAMMERQLDSLVRLIDDLTDLSRVSLGTIKLEREPAMLGELVRDSVEQSKALIDAAGIAFTVELPERDRALDVDPTRFARVLTTLLNNAAKTTPRGGRIDLCARIAPRPDGSSEELTLGVKDSGAGISAAMLPRVFDPFIPRGDDTPHGVLAVGLAIARAVVEMHGGRIEARSEGLDRGSEFVIRLPLPPAGKLAS